MDIPNRERLDALFHSDAYTELLDASLESWGGGTATVRWTPRQRHCNFAGTVHGGAVFSLADMAFAVSSNSWGRVSVALTVEAHYLAAPRLGVGLVAVSEERSRSQRTASYLIEVREDDEAGAGELVASVHAMVYRTGVWHFGDDAWPADWRDTH